MRGRRAWVAVGVVIVLLIAGLLLIPGTPGRRLITDLRTSACHKASVDHGAVALGDSITEGFNDTAWGFQAANSWFGQAVCTGHPPLTYGYNAGVFGQTTAQMLARVDRDVLAHHPRQVFILGGTNDLTQGVAPTVTIANLREIAKRSSAGGARVFLCTIPPREDQAYAARTKALNADIEKLGEQLHVPVLDFYSALVDRDGTYRSGLNRDPLHPSDAGAQMMARVALADVGKSQVG